MICANKLGKFMCNLHSCMNACMCQTESSTDDKISLIHNIQYSWIKKKSHTTHYSIYCPHTRLTYSLFTAIQYQFCKMLIVVVVVLIGCVFVFFFKKNKLRLSFPLCFNCGNGVIVSDSNCGRVLRPNH